MGSIGRIKVALIYGSTRESCFCDTVAGWVAEQVWKHETYAVDPIDPSRLADADAAERLARADALILVVPGEGHDGPDDLQASIALLDPSWAARPVAFVSFGGASGGLPAVEPLRQRFAERGAKLVGETLSFANAWEQFDARGYLRRPDAAERAMARLLSELRAVTTSPSSAPPGTVVWEAAA